MKFAGAKLSFLKDLGYKFTGDKKIEGLLNLEREQSWQVLGAHDFLRVLPINTLEQGADGSEKSVSGPIGPNNSLILYSMKSEASEVLNRALTHRVVGGKTESSKPLQDEIARYPFLVTARFSLSAVSYELATLLNGVNAAQESLENIVTNLMQSHAGTVQFAMFRTLGSPDLVMLALPVGPQEISHIRHCLQQIRQLSVEDLERAVFQVETRPELTRTFEDARLPGHALASVEDFVSFRVTGTGKEIDVPAFHTPQFQKEEKDCGVRISFVMRVDSGHKFQVAKEIQDNGLATLRSPSGTLLKSGYSLSTGQSRLHGDCESFSQFFRFWSELLTVPTWRIANLVYCRSTVFLDQQPSTAVFPHGQHIAWRIKDEVVRELAEIESSIERWGEQFLPTPQQYELNNLVLLFKNCFHHHELVSAARDLLPFFRQFARACKGEYFEDWKAFIAISSEQFAIDVSDLLAHLNRAVRNRMEHRSAQSDPPTPHTLEHGACKIIHGYFSTLWVCDQVLRHSKGKTDYCSAEDIAICVAAGVKGRVECREIFSEVRRAVEKRGVREDGWTSRLLLLDISGKTLFRPESALAHGLHEMAEMTNWLEIESSRAVRNSVSKWIRDEIGRYWYEEEADGLTEAKRQLRHFFTNFVLGLARHSHVVDGKICQSTVPDARPSEYFTTFLKRLRSWSLSPSNTKFMYVRYAQKYFVNLEMSTREKLWPLLDNVSLSAVPPEFDAWLRQLIAPSLQQKFRHLMSCLPEYLADFGMVLALKTLLSASSEFEEVDNISVAFRSIVQSYSEWQKLELASGEAKDALLQRWAMQLAIVSPGRWREILPQHVASSPFGHMFDVAGFLGKSETKSLKSHFGDESTSLSQRLRELRSSTSTKGRDNASDSELIIWDYFADTWNQLRQESRSLPVSQTILLSALWAKSTRFCYGAIFAPVHN